MARAKNNNKTKEKDAEEFRGQILKWYDANRRELPWRAGSGEMPDPYRVWLSEIMLQQTTVNAVIPYFSKFTEKWPNGQALAAAETEEIMAAWAGLGYYARARNLHKCAQIVAYERGGVFPQEEKALKALPGIGDYTGAAIAAIAFNRPANVVDGNIERIMARYFLVREPLPVSKKKLKILAGSIAEGEAKRPGDYAQALMDLGAAICTPQSPKCGVCPVKAGCLVNMEGIAGGIPVKKVKENKPKRRGYVYWIENEKNEVLIQRRPSRGLLGGMKALPTSEWRSASENAAPEHPVMFTGLAFEKGKKRTVYHSFTHFDLELILQKGRVRDFRPEKDYSWTSKDGLEEAGFPTVFAKARRLFAES